MSVEAYNEYSKGVSVSEHHAHDTIVIAADHSQVTLVKDAIHHPDDARHYMVLEESRGHVTAYVGDVMIAASSQSICLKEVGYRLYDHSLYILKEEVLPDVLIASDFSTTCELKGTTTYYDLQVGDKRLINAAWEYTALKDHDPRLNMLSGRVAFNREFVDVNVSYVKK